MSKWENRVSEHPIVAGFESLASVLDSDSLSPADNPAAIEEINRLRQICDYGKRLLETIDPVLVPPAILNNAHGPLQNITNEITAYRSKQNPGHLTNANSHADTLLTYLYQLPTLNPVDQVEGAREAMGSFRRSAGQYLSLIEREKSEIAADLTTVKARADEISAEIATQKARLDTAISEYQKQFSNSENTRREEFAARQIARDAEHTTAVEERHRLFSQHLEEIKNSGDVALNTHSEKFNATIAQSHDAGRIHIAKLEEFRDQAQDLMHVIGSTGMSGEFQKAATSARHQLWFWQGVTIVAMLGLIAFAILAYVSVKDGEFTLAAVGARMFVAIAFGILAVFAARQADKYHATEAVNRRYQLELSSIDPYLAALPLDQRLEIKAKLAERFFGNTELNRTPPRSTVNSEGTSIDMARMALETVQNYLKTTR